MVIGGGMMARTFASTFASRDDIVIFAAGVSNSQCRDDREYARERDRLADAIAAQAPATRLVYFSTCSVADPEASETPYVRHKLAMERLVRGHPRHVVFRLPQVAGRTPNPHTLLNYLYARIVRGERFSVWANAHRNIIDSDDVAKIVAVIMEAGMRDATINVANEQSVAMPEIVRAIERVTNASAIYDLVDRGGRYAIDVSSMQPFRQAAGVEFDDLYLERIVRKYYG